jgi:hypothetical protein
MRQSLLAAVLAFCTGVPIAAQQQCSQTPYGQGCGPTLTVSFSPIGAHHKISVLMQGGFAHSHGVWIWGIQDLAFPIPGTQCFLYTDFVYGHPFISAPDGTALMEHSWPNSLNGAYVRLQAASLSVDGSNNLLIRTTNGVFAECH